MLELWAGPLTCEGLAGSNIEDQHMTVICYYYCVDSSKGYVTEIMRFFDVYVCVCAGKLNPIVSNSQYPYKETSQHSFFIMKNL